MQIVFGTKPRVLFQKSQPLLIYAPDPYHIAEFHIVRTYDRPTT